MSDYYLDEGLDYGDDGDLYADDVYDEPAAIDPATIAAMQTYVDEAQAAGQAAYDQQLAEFEARQAQEYAARAAEQQQAELEAEAAEEMITRIYNTAVNAGLDPADTDAMMELHSIASGLTADRQFQSEHGDMADQVRAAFSRAASLIGEEPADEVEAAANFMERRRAHRALDENRSGDADRSVRESALELYAIVGDEDKRNPELRERFGLE
jgi:hypothetical protein